MNAKSVEFEKFLKEEEIDCFEKKDFQDEEGTVVYRSYVQSPIGNMPIFVILDNSVYSVLRLVVGPEVVTSENTADINRLINRENARYKHFKLYIDEDDNTVYLDCVAMNTAEHFEPGLIYALMSQIVEYIPHIVGDLKEAFHLEGRFVTAMEQHQQEHFQEQLAAAKEELANKKKSENH